MIDNVETILRWRQENNVFPSEAESVHIKFIIKEIAKTFPNEWDEALEEIERANQP